LDPSIDAIGRAENGWYTSDACQEEMRAFERLRFALRCESTATHLLACGALLDVPGAANDMKAI
jgi:hypothetical protein